MSASPQEITKRILDDDRTLPADLVATVAAWPVQRQAELQKLLLPHPEGRRWLRSVLLPELAGDVAAELAHRLLEFAADFSVNRRDSTTTYVVQALRFDDIASATTFFAASNAAGAFWRRLVSEQSDLIPDLVRLVLREGDAVARETTLYLLVLDPYSDVRLTGSARVEVLLSALDDQSDDVRGLAADALADEFPEHLVVRLSVMMLDASERVRMAVWDAALDVDFATSRDAALDLLVDESASLDARRTALVALSAVLSTLEIAPVLEAIVVHPERALAEVAADLLWSYHRAPSIALAAAESPHESVREAAERLLNPKTGSPAAGGSRPGAPDRSHDIYQAMINGYERPKE